MPMPGVSCRREFVWGEPFFVGGEDYWELKGRIDREGDEMVADLTGYTGGQAGFFKGAVKLEEPFQPSGLMGSGGFSSMWFGISTNADPTPMIKKYEAQNRRAIVEATTSESKSSTKEFSPEP